MTAQQRPPQAARPAPPAPPAGGSAGGSGGRSGRGRRAGSGGGRPPLFAPLLALIGLVLIAAGSLYVVSVFGVVDETATTPTTEPVAEVTAGPSGEVPVESAAPVVTPTPHPTSVNTPPPDDTADIVGTIVFSKDGDLYTATGKSQIQFIKGAKTEKDSVANEYPTWSPDGKRIYYIQTRTKEVNAPYQGKLAKYTFYFPNIMSISPNGGDAKLVYSSIFPSQGGQWHRWVLQPDVSPDGSTFALVTDGNDGIGDVLLGTMTTKGQGLKQIPNVPAVDAQGHNDPDWSPDGRRIAFTYNNRSGNVGTPKIGVYNTKTKKTTLITKQGYANPSWSPDGRVLAAERTTGSGRDIVILDPTTGAEIVRLTNDGDSFAPTFSPNGDQIAFLRRKGLGVDLYVLTLDPANGYTRVKTKAVTDDGSLDAESPPAWFIPKDQLRPLVTPGPDVSLAPVPSDDVEASAAP